MATTIVPAAMVARTRHITPDVLTAASLLVRIAHPGDASLGRALAKAESRLIETPWTITCGILQIASHSHPSDVHCTDGNECTCETTRGVCWHIASWLILSTIGAAGITPIAPLPLPSCILDEEVDDYPGDFLDSLPDSRPAPEPFRLQPAREIIPAPGSELERSQNLADRMFAA